VKKIIGAVLVLGLIIGGAYAVKNNNEVHTAAVKDPGGGGH
jgi:hypothetical protein